MRLAAGALGRSSSASKQLEGQRQRGCAAAGGATAAPPPKRTPQVLYGAGDAVVRLFSAIDERLEESGLFSRLLPKEIPK